MDNFQNYYENQKKSTVVAVLLWLFFGIFGVHRIYLHKKLSAGFMFGLSLITAFTGVGGMFGKDSGFFVFFILFIISCSALGLWLLIDLFLIRGMVAEDNIKFYNELQRSAQANTISIQNSIKENTSINCKYCNSEIPANSTFCEHCGKKIDYAFCKYCSAKIISGSNYCLSCGQKIT